MPADYEIYTDMSADLPAEVAKREGIAFVPMSFTIGQKSETIERPQGESELKAFYDAQRSGEPTHTTQISPYMYTQLFEPVLASGRSVLYISLSSGLSSTYSSSLVAAEELNERFASRLVCVDSLAATAGMGMLIELAAKNRASGMSLEENAKWLEENRLRIYHWFMVEDLMFLKKGGRIPATTAIVGSAFSIKPILKVNPDGTLSAFGKKRGSRAAMNELVELYAAHSAGGDSERIMILHSDDPEKAEYLRQRLLEKNPGADISVMLLSPVIGAHVGPGMCAVVHLAPEGVSRD